MAKSSWSGTSGRPRHSPSAVYHLDGGSMTDRAFTRWQCVALVLFCALLAPLWPSSAGAVTGNDWRALPASARTSYVTGVVDNLVDFGAAVRSLVPAEK